MFYEILIPTYILFGIIAVITLRKEKKMHKDFTENLDLITPLKTKP